MTRAEITYELFINAEIRYKNFLSYMNLSKDYSVKEINSLYEAGQSKELDLSFLLGTLIMNDKTSANHSKYINLSRDEPKFRNYLLEQLNKNGNSKISKILKSQSIFPINIKRESISQSFLLFQPKRFLELIVAKSDLKIIRFFHKKKILSEKEMKEFIGS